MERFWIRQIQQDYQCTAPTEQNLYIQTKMEGNNRIFERSYCNNQKTLVSICLTKVSPEDNTF